MGRKFVSVRGRGAVCPGNGRSEGIVYEFKREEQGSG